MSWSKIKKTHHFEALLSLILHKNSEQFLAQVVMSDKKCFFIQWLALTSSVIGPRRSSKALPKAELAPRKGHVYCLVVCCQSGPLQLSESQRKCYVWEVCSANRWGALKTARPTASIGQQNEPSSSDDVVQPVLQKLNKLGYEVLPHVPYSPDLSATTTSSSISTTFAGKTLP